MRFEQTVRHMCDLVDRFACRRVNLAIRWHSRDISRTPYVPDGTIEIARAVHLTNCIIDICFELALLLCALNRGKGKLLTRATKDFNGSAILRRQLRFGINLKK